LKTVNLTSQIKENADFISRVGRESGQPVQHCYQCGKCSAGCPMATAMDYLPNQVMRMVQAGMREEALACETIWLCAFCSTCTARCPKNVDLAQVMESLRIMAGQQGIAPRGRGRNVSLFIREFLNSIEKYGRLHEFNTMSGYNLKSGRPFQNAATGLDMLRKGKLRMTIHKPKGLAEIQRIFARVRQMEGEDK
jgi:heterodisulfide reductase subunit C